MNDRSHIASGAIGAIIVALCCAAPLLVLASGSASLTAWLANAYYVPVSAVLILVAVVALLLYRPWTMLRGHGKSNADRRGSKS